MPNAYLSEIDMFIQGRVVHFAVPSRGRTLQEVGHRRRFRPRPRASGDAGAARPLPAPPLPD